jgi:hypothetical protein
MGDTAQAELDFVFKCIYNRLKLFVNNTGRERKIKFDGAAPLNLGTIPH